MKSICLVLLIASLAFAAEQSQVSAENFKSDVKEVDLQKLATTWYQIAGTKDLQDVLKGCTCNTLKFSSIPNNEHKLLGVSSCKNASTNAVKSVNGTLTRVGKGNANAFRIEFIEADVKPIKKEISEEEASKIKPIKEDIIEHKKDDSKKDDSSNKQKLEDSSKADASKKDDASKTQKLEEAHTPNVFIAKLDQNYKHFALVTPQLRSAAILSQEKTMDETTMKSYTDYLSSKGFTNMAKIDQSSC